MWFIDYLIITSLFYHYPDTSQWPLRQCCKLFLQWIPVDLLEGESLRVADVEAQKACATVLANLNSGTPASVQ